MNRVLFAVSIVAVIILAVVFFIMDQPQQNAEVVAQNSGGDWSLSRDGLTFTYPSVFGLAMNSGQILASSALPPCDVGFDYCMYYLGSEYQGTNFASAGLRIDKRDDLQDETCLTEEPSGQDLTPGIYTSERYVTVRFSPLGDSEEGQYSTGALYRIWYESGCYELETRIGLSAYDELGAVRELTAEEQLGLESTLVGIVEGTTFTDNHTKLMFPR